MIRPSRMRQRTVPRILKLFAVVGTTALLWSPPSLAAPDRVIVVRHAEKAAAPADDPGLSPQGVARAQALAGQLRGAEVRTIFTTQYRRTLETARPTAEAARIEPRVIEAQRGSGATHVQEVIAAVRAASGTVLVVGHSNTVPEIVAALSGRPVQPLCETSFSHLFEVDLGDPDTPVRHRHYGAPDAEPISGCQ